MQFEQSQEHRLLLEQELDVVYSRMIPKSLLMTEERVMPL